MASNKKVVVTCNRKYKSKDEEHFTVNGKNSFASIEAANGRFLKMLIEKVDAVLAKAVSHLEDLGIEPEDVYISFKIKAPEDENQD